MLESFGKFWKVMEIYNVIFKDLESFQKRELFQNGFGTVLEKFCFGKF